MYPMNIFNINVDKLFIALSGTIRNRNMNFFSFIEDLQLDEGICDIIPYDKNSKLVIIPNQHRYQEVLKGIFNCASSNFELIQTHFIEHPLEYDGQKFQYDYAKSILNAETPLFRIVSSDIIPYTIDEYMQRYKDKFISEESIRKLKIVDKRNILQLSCVCGRLRGIRSAFCLIPMPNSVPTGEKAITGVFFASPKKGIATVLYEYYYNIATS